MNVRTVAPAIAAALVRRLAHGRGEQRGEHAAVDERDELEVRVP